MRFRILGPIEVEGHDGPVQLGGRKQRLVLAHLLRRPNEIVPSNVLIDDVWGDEPPDAARNTLQTYVYRLRAAVGADRLDGSPGGYRLRVEPAELDALEFERLVTEGRREIVADPAVGIRTLKEALDLWRGPAFGDLGDELSLKGEIARFDESRKLAQEDRLAAELDLGRHAALIGELEALTLEDPLRERPWALRMLALYRSGRQADALAAFRRVQTLLAEELGIDPGRSLQDLHRRILAQDPTLLVASPDADRDPVRAGSAPSLQIFLIADIRGYTSFTSDRGDEAAAALATKFAALARNTVEVAGGSVVELRGDEALAVFSSARNAIRAAVDLQTRFVEETVADPTLPLAVGIGIDAGEAVEVEGGYRGGALNLAARLCGSAGPAEILASREVVHLARKVEGIVDIERGTVRFKGLTEPIGVVQIRAEGWDPVQDLAFQRALGPAVAGLRPDDSALGAPNPYKGLLPFEETDEETFFGREALTQELVMRSSRARFMAVVGPSGSGKSSVVRAGLIPALRAGGIPGSESWPIVQMVPGAHPMVELETALLKVAPDRTNGLLEVLEDTDLGILRAFKRIEPPDEVRIVLFIDQLEEVFTLVDDEDQRSRFLAGIAALVNDPHARVLVITTLRADFYDRPLQYAGFADLMRSFIEPVVPLAPDELERAIAGPARSVGMELEPGLLAELLAEVADEPGALPLLQYALTELFDRREGRELTLAAYRAIGGVSGALAGRADDLYGASGETAKDATRQLFLRLLTLGEGTEDVRRRVSRAEIASLDVDQEAMSGVLDRFGASRLLSFDRDARSHEATVEVAHEALLRSWPRLREWIDDAREDVRMSRRLGAATAGWLESGRDPSFLLRGGQLAQYESWADQTSVAPTEDERIYLESSQRDREAVEAAERERSTRELAVERRSARRLRVVVAVVTVAAVVAGALTIVASNQRDQAERQTRIATARELATAALSTMNADPELGILLALQAVETTREVDGSVIKEAEEALHQAVGSSRLVRYLDDPSSGTVSFSPDGSRVATSQRLSQDSLMADPVVWDTTTGDRVLTLAGHTDNVNDIQFSPVGSRLATASWDGTVRLWDTDTGAEIRSIRADEAAPLGAAFNVDFSRDGSRVAVTTSPGDEATIGVFEVASGRQVLAIPTPYTVCGIDYSPDGKAIAGGECFGTGLPTAHLWSATTGVEIRAFGGHSGYDVTNVAFSPDGRHLLSVGYDGVGTVWDAASGRAVASLFGHTGGIETVDISADGRLVATSSTDGTARVWDSRTGEPLLTLSGGGARLGEVRFSPDGSTLVTGSYDGSSQVWDITPEGVREDVTVAAHGAAWEASYSLDGASLVGIDDFDVRMWDAGTGRRLDEPPGRSILSAFVPEDERSLVSVDPPIVQDRTSGRFSSPEPPGIHTDSVLSPDGRLLVVGDESGRLAVWDTSTGRRLRELDPPSEQQPSVSGLAFTPDGSILVSVSTDGSAKVWDVGSYRLIRTLHHADRLNGVAVSPDGEAFVTASGDGIARIWGIDGAPIEVLAGHVGAIQAVAFSPDGELIATAGQDETLRLWNVTSGREILALREHAEALSDVSFSPDGTRLVSASFDGSIRTYVLPLDELIEIARSRLTRTWTPEECRQYLQTSDCPAPA
jgi:WD40 repeat protein/DNA-binding SARP family transcriptional activator